MKPAQPNTKTSKDILRKLIPQNNITYKHERKIPLKISTEINKENNNDQVKVSQESWEQH